MIGRHLQEAYHQGKRTVANVWNHAVKFAGQLDHGFGVAKRLYGALQPAIQDLGGSQINQGIMRGFGAYEQGRNQALSGFNQVQAMQSRIKKAVPEIDF